MQYGKTIEMFLVNGEASGLVTAELSNWNGKAIKVPRTMVKDCARDDIKGVGIYFLFCEEDGHGAVYIGEAENVLDRLNGHLRDFQAGKESYYWTTAVVFIGRDLNKALIRYLEDRIWNIINECGRLRNLTKNTYKKTVLKESQIASMEEFVDNVKVLLSALGYQALTPMPKADDDTIYLLCKSTKGANAKGFASENGFTVLEGSTISEDVVPSFVEHGSGYHQLRCDLQEAGVIDNGVFVQDYEFKAPSAASAVVLGRTSNGNNDWKTEGGIKLKDL